MRPRTFILLILVLVVAAAAVVLIFFVGRDGLLGDDETAQPVSTAAPVAGEAEGQETSPTPTPILSTVDVVVARVDLPVGERITRGLVEVEQRPDTNVAVVAGVTFDDPDLVVGQIVKTAVSEGQEILRPMLALNPSDIASLGSDLGLYIDQGNVAVAFPIDRFSGAAYALRPGDFVDAFMSLTLVDIDPEFNTRLPNIVERVYEPDLLAGRAFLFPPTEEGRLELIPLINAVAEIKPGEGKEPIPRRVSQLTLQQMEVLWVGTWRRPQNAMAQEFGANAVRSELLTPAPNQPPARPTPIRPELAPDAVILSMS
ncbi:MAG: SAF domain-containing protein, partial [Candidatus Promineifilaceae bacterium]|nr:SAF domain-containing protein [Candidatus Promineifilaceae bacterium]